MLSHYYIEVRYEPVMANGAFRSNTLRIKAKSYTGALMSALKTARDKGLEVRKLIAHPEVIPVSAKERKKLVFAKKEAKEADRQRLENFNLDE